MVFIAIDCHIDDVKHLLEVLGDELTILDLSRNDVREVNANVYKKFTKLEYLYLHDANLTEFHLFEQLPIKLIDISRNYLTQVRLPVGAKALKVLDLTDNNLTNISDVNSSRFPMLSMLAISRNLFSCEYLEGVLPEIKRNWPAIQFIGDPWVQKHNENWKAQHGTNAAEITPILYPSSLLVV